MEWAPDSPDLWAPDSRHPDRWAPDSHGHLTLGRAVDLFLAAKAAEGVSPRTSEWYRMILVRLVRSTGPDRAVDGIDPAELRAWLVELRTTLAPVSVAGYVRTLRVLGNWLAAEGLAEAAALRGAAPAASPAQAHRARRRRRPSAAPRGRRPSVTGRSCSSCSTPVSECPRWPGSGWATCGPDGTRQGQRQGLQGADRRRSARPPAGDRPLSRPARPGAPRRRAVARPEGRDQRPRPPAHASTTQGPGRGDRAR